MTEQQKPSNLRAAFADFGAALDQALAEITVPVAATAALVALLSEENATAHEHLDGLDADQLQAIEDAAVALSLTACQQRNAQGTIHP